jgi:membrane-associated phospholipid phosphatase
MGSAGTIWTSTLVLCLVVASSGCSRQRSFGRRDRLPLAAVPESTLYLPQTPSSATTVAPALSSAAPFLAGSCADDLAVSPGSCLWSTCQETGCKLWTDYENFYSWDVARDLLLGISATSVLANTSLDQGFRDWYQDDVRSSGTSDAGYVFKPLGDGRYVIPACAGLALLGGMWDDTQCSNAVEEFGCRTTRAYLVGTPTLIFWQYTLGAARPGEADYESQWRPFENSHGASGHAFVGAVPFISAARMTDDPYLKATLYACSILPAWSRVDHDRHYLSQVWLGWWMAYLACRAVDHTEREWQSLTLTPVATPEMVGVGAIYEW